jgi:hypothetical protein
MNSVISLGVSVVCVSLIMNYNLGELVVPVAMTAFSCWGYTVAKWYGHFDCTCEYYEMCPYCIGKDFDASGVRISDENPLLRPEDRKYL